MKRRLRMRNFVGVLFCGALATLVAFGSSADVGGEAGASGGVETPTILQPTPSRQAQEVVSIQLNALKNNDSPTKDAGIAQVWAFAHPQNKNMTGPLPRFTRMIRSPGYAVLLNHRKHEISEVRETPTDAAFAVRVLAQDGNFYGFQWQLKKAALEIGPSWMTTRVSAARTTGEQLSWR
ncbi:MAG: DUF4864 domain-containing protein [Spiribacter sp.]|nr:DUF4864 domain-containing protein [Spiribacter sp.]MDR9480894.1 DUF4864 domain-containing protein [Spiribacter sp.]